MILASLNLGDTNKLEFGMQIAGTTVLPTGSRFVIQGNLFDINCKCIQLGDTIEVEVPKLKSVLAPGVYKVRLETILHDKLFTPVNEEIEFRAAVDIVVATVNSNNMTTRVIPLAEPTAAQKSVMPQVAHTTGHIAPENLIDLFNKLSEGKQSADETAMIQAVNKSASWATVANIFAPSNIVFEHFTDKLSKCIITGKQGKDTFVLETVINNKKVIEAQTSFDKVSKTVTTSFKDFLKEATDKKA
jgi:hypothetical protein